MSDRIEELMGAGCFRVDCHVECESCPFTELATIALKAEAELAECEARISYLEADNKAMWQIVFWAEKSVDNGFGSMELEEAVEEYFQKLKAAREGDTR